MGLVWSGSKPPPPPLVQRVRKLLSKQAASPACGGALVKEPGLVKLFGSYLPVVLTLLPSFYMLYTGSAESISLYFSPISMCVGVGNSFAWLLYNTVLMRDNPSPEEILANGLVLLSNGQNLMSVCTWKGLKQRGYTMGISICIGLLLILCLLIWAPTLPSWAKYSIGGLGITTSIGTHVLLLIDIVKSPSDHWTRLFTAMNLAPNMILNLAYFVVTKGWRDQDIITQIASGIGFLFKFVEMIILMIFRSPDMDVNAPGEDEKKDDSPGAAKEDKKAKLTVNNSGKRSFLGRNKRIANDEKQTHLTGNNQGGAGGSLAISTTPAASTTTSWPLHLSRKTDSMRKRQRLEREKQAVEIVQTANPLCRPWSWCRLFSKNGSR